MMDVVDGAVILWANVLELPETEVTIIWGLEKEAAAIPKNVAEFFSALEKSQPLQMATG